MCNAAEHAFKEKSAKLLILLSLRTIYFRTFQSETPCTMYKKRPKICTCCRVSKAKFYLYHSTKIVKVRPGFDDQPEHPSVQINSSSPWTDSANLCPVGYRAIKGQLL